MKSLLICISSLLLLLTGSPVYGNSPELNTYAISGNSNAFIYEIPASGNGALETQTIVVNGDTELPASADVLVYYIVRDPEVAEALSSPELLAKYKQSHTYLDDLNLAEFDGSEEHSRFDYSAIWQVGAAEDKDGSGFTLFYDVPESTWISIEFADNKDQLITRTQSCYQQEAISAETDLAQYLLTK